MHLITLIGEIKIYYLIMNPEWSKMDKMGSTIFSCREEKIG